jgi:hypothetical protein
VCVKHCIRKILFVAALRVSPRRSSRLCRSLNWEVKLSFLRS